LSPSGLTLATEDLSDEGHRRCVDLGVESRVQRKQLRRRVPNDRVVDDRVNGRRHSLVLGRDERICCDLLMVQPQEPPTPLPVGRGGQQLDEAVATLVLRRVIAHAYAGQ